jgi:hypothetical protein
VEELAGVREVDILVTLLPARYGTRRQNQSSLALGETLRFSMHQIIKPWTHRTHAFFNTITG